MKSNGLFVVVMDGAIQIGNKDNSLSDALNVIAQITEDVDDLKARLKVIQDCNSLVKSAMISTRDKFASELRTLLSNIGFIVNLVKLKVESGKYITKVLITFKNSVSADYIIYITSDLSREKFDEIGKEYDVLSEKIDVEFYNVRNNNVIKANNVNEFIIAEQNNIKKILLD